MYTKYKSNKFTYIYKYMYVEICSFAIIILTIMAVYNTSSVSNEKKRFNLSSISTFSSSYMNATLLNSR